jgi:hypothetical protein
MRAALPAQIVDLRSVCLNGFASLFSTFFDFSRDKQYFLLLVECAQQNLSLEALCNLKRLSADRLFFYVNQESVDEMLGFTNRALQSCLSLLKKNGKKLSRWGFLVAIDLTDVEYFGLVDEYVHNYVKRMGKVYKPVLVRRYATVSIVSPRFKLCLAILPVRKTDRLEDLVDRLLESVRGVKIRCVILDKGFYNVGVLDRIEAHRLCYLLPVVKKKDADLLYWLSSLTGRWKWRHIMAANKPWKKPVTIYFQERQVGDYTGFITNRDMKTDTAEKLIKLYDQRWNIENGYKEAEDFWIKTTSKNHAYRLLLYTISHILVNLQNIVRETRYRVRYYEMLEIIRLVLDPTTKQGMHPVSKRLTIIL